MRMGRKWFEENEMLEEKAARLLYHDILTGSLKDWQFCHSELSEIRLSAIEEKIGPVIEFDSIYEIGPGNGSFYRAVQERGFKGTYYICDIPWMQKALAAGGVEATWVDRAPKNVGLFIAHYSLSEIPIEFRAVLIPEEFEAAYIIYQGQFSDRCPVIDNSEFFKEWRTALHDTHEYEEDDRDNLYLWKRK